MLSNGSNSLFELLQATVLGIRALPELLKLRTRSRKILPHIPHPVGEGTERRRMRGLLMQCEHKAGSPKLQALQAMRERCQLALEKTKPHRQGRFRRPAVPHRGAGARSLE